MSVTKMEARPELKTVREWCPICPRCGHEDRDWWTDMHDMGDGESVETECGMCGSPIMITTHINISFTTTEGRSREQQ
ncbi:hypothetical protein BMS3Abin14_01502 [bacterium BMS3Abin14]|nr:hypothetical protein BMS3Abin14_01502 [bacterium BMS3Abin14]